MAPPLLPPVVRVQQSFQSLQQWFPLVLYGMIGTLSTYIMTHHNLDMMSDRIKATYNDHADTFDFIIGKFRTVRCRILIHFVHYVVS